mmetsp:Transcript_104690/g.197305  ORF Transcript_104690/g.197305 Transcript_104690/m.197305 type:complete len:202 (-) Transcript_104690:296-901(-)
MSLLQPLPQICHLRSPHHFEEAGRASAMPNRQLHQLHTPLLAVPRGLHGRHRSSPAPQHIRQWELQHVKKPLGENRCNPGRRLHLQAAAQVPPDAPPHPPGSEHQVLHFWMNETCTSWTGRCQTMQQGYLSQTSRAEWGGAVRLPSLQTSLVSPLKREHHEGPAQPCSVRGFPRKGPPFREGLWPHRLVLWAQWLAQKHFC